MRLRLSRTMSTFQPLCLQKHDKTALAVPNTVLPLPVRRLRQIRSQQNGLSRMNKVLIPVFALCSLVAQTAAGEVATGAQAQPPPAETPPALVQPALNAAVEFWSNRRGGIEEGSRWDVQVDSSLVFALDRLGGAKNSQLVAQFWWVRNQKPDSDMDALTGAFNDVRGTKAANQTRVMNFHYKQGWDDGAVELKAGMVVVDDDFMNSCYADVLSNSCFGTLPTEVGTPLAASLDNHGAVPSYPVAAPGIVVSFGGNHPFSSRVGLYHGGPGPDASNNHGFDWDRLSAAGVVIFAESAWRTTVTGRENVLHAGASYHTGTFDNFSRINAGYGTATVRGLFGAYLFDDLTLSCAPDGKPRLGLFWHVGASPQLDRSVVSTYADLGLSWFGPLPARPNDTVGFGFSWTRFGTAYRRCAGPSVLAASETVWEATYRAELTGHWFLQAEWQWLGNPSDPSGSGHRRDAMVVGLRSGVAF